MKIVKGKSYIVYEGPSLIDGSPIVCIAQVGSSNTKTGDMVQTYIIRSDMNPLEASKTGGDVAICGDCMHRGQKTDSPLRKQAENRTCYVLLGQGVLGKYKALKKGVYEAAETLDDLKEIGKGRVVRLGTYGDMLAVPDYVTGALLTYAESWTAYTHRKNTYPEVFMTSADNRDQAEEAWGKGERTFRVIADVGEVVEGKEIICPATKEGGQKTTCIQCKLCSGNQIFAKSIAAVAHGVMGNKLKNIIREVK